MSVAVACANVALIKYWGKRDPVLNTPESGSLAVTLDALRTVTEVELTDAGEDELRLDGILRDFRRDHVDFDVAPTNGFGHYAGSLGLALDADGCPVYTGAGYEVLSQWRDAQSRPIAPNLACVGSDDLIDFQIIVQAVITEEDFVVELRVLGAAIQSGSSGYHKPVTMMLDVGGTSFEPFGLYDDPVYGNLNDEQFVDQVYMNVLGRPADPGGKAYWTGQLTTGVTRGQVMLPSCSTFSATGARWRSPRDLSPMPA